MKHYFFKSFYLALLLLINHSNTFGENCSRQTKRKCYKGNHFTIKNDTNTTLNLRIDYDNTLHCNSWSAYDTIGPKSKTKSPVCWKLHIDKNLSIDYPDVKRIQISGTNEQSDKTLVLQVKTKYNILMSGRLYYKENDPKDYEFYGCSTTYTKCTLHIVDLKSVIPVTR